MLLSMKMYGRIVTCGMIAAYNQRTSRRRSTTCGRWSPASCACRASSCSDDEPRGGSSDLHDWVRLGRAGRAENVTRGIDNAGEAFSHLMAGSTVGKTLIELDLPEAA